MSKKYKITLTKHEIEEYNKNRHAMLNCQTRLEVKLHREICHSILERGRNRYIDNLEHHVNGNSTKDKTDN